MDVQYYASQKGQIVKSIPRPTPFPASKKKFPWQNLSHPLLGGPPTSKCYLQTPGVSILTLAVCISIYIALSKEITGVI